MKIGEKLKLLRHLEHLTQQDLAKELFVSYQLISKWERNITTPSVETLFHIINKYHLEIDFFMDNSTENEQQTDIKYIFEAFTKCMIDATDTHPTIKQISAISNIPLSKIAKYFTNIEEIAYAFIVDVDSDIKKELETHVFKGKDPLTIFIEDMMPLLYQKRVTLHLLYTRSYIKGIWLNFINNKYKKLLINHPSINETSHLELEYLISVLTSIISVWLGQTHPEPLDTVQKRITTLIHTNIDSWSVII
ncbi:helix-turn-helix domain-containing protein [Leuconostoc sp. MS02]|uniref:Helix-turn-helix domain-containing protein n=1 Tax=Leuconostoc aquikimchii TaxID=3236804 RepID=A0ABV3S0K4_9LACO